MRVRRPFPGALLLLALAACQRPVIVPWENRLASAAVQPASSLREDQRRDYEEGFRTGARMVHSAVQLERRPYRMVLDRIGTAEFRPAGPVAAAASGGQGEPTVEMDPATGLLRLALSPEEPFTRGVVAGFDWAMAEEGHPMVRPSPAPTRPDHWQPWLDTAAVLGLQDGEQHIQLRCGAGILAWQTNSRGFPGQRGWRSWPEPSRPAWVAFAEGALWVETAAGKALALDPASGAIRAVAPALPHPQAAAGKEASPQLTGLRQDGEHLQRVLTLTGEARQGKVPAMLELARELRGIDPTGDREAYGWLLKAAEAGNLEAMVDVGTCCFHGLGRPSDREEARRWLLRAEQAGSPTAREVRRLLFEVGTAP